MKCFEILRYAVHFRYTMLCCFIYLGKAEIYILHIILLLLCLAGFILMSGSFRPWWASLIFLGAAQNQEEEMVLVKGPFSIKYETQDNRGIHMGKHKETVRQCWSAWMTVWCPYTSSLALVTLFHNLHRGWGEIVL